MLGFRVWDSKDKCFYIDPSDDGLFSDAQGELIAITETGEIIFSPKANQRFIPMQSTGIKDFQGVMIYEGDVLFIRYTRPLGNSEITKSLYFHVESVVNFLQSLGALHPIDKISCDGNIYEHPKLLERLKKNEAHQT